MRFVPALCFVLLASFLAGALAAQPRQTIRHTKTLYEDSVEIPARGLRKMDVAISAPGSRIFCEFVSLDETRRLEAQILYRIEKSDGAGVEYESVLKSGYVRNGRINYIAEQPGIYVVVVEPEPGGSDPLAASLAIRLITESVVEVIQPETLSLRKRLVISVLSLGFVVAVALYSGRRILTSLRNRRTNEPPLW
jgi:hypothetical protein